MPRPEPWGGNETARVYNTCRRNSGGVRLLREVNFTCGSQPILWESAVALGDQIRQAAQEIANDIRTRLSDAGHRLVEERLLKFPVQQGSDHLCPRCWIEKGGCHRSKKSPTKGTVTFSAVACANTNFWFLMCKLCRHRPRYAEHERRMSA